MALNYALYDNPITADLNDRMAVTQTNQTFTLEDVFDEMTRQGSTVTKAEGLAVFEEFSRGLERLLKNGNSVNTPLFNLNFSIAGVFDGDDDSFDASRHQVKLRINPGVRLRELENQVSVTKVTAEKRIPILVHYYDTNSETQDSVLSAGGGGRITGTNLKFDESDPAQGVFFVDISNGTVAKATSKPLRNKPGELIFINPALSAGSYRIEVRTIFIGGKDLRTGSLNTLLSVS